jgi:lipoprotein-releasing system permease protein
MYKLLLCWRYLFTRYIALASIVSVMLGVGTMIVVNSVMEGFSNEMRNRIHGILSDIVFESRSGLEGFQDPAAHMAQIRQVAGDAIEGMTPVVMVPAMLNYDYRGNPVVQQVQLIGIDESTQGQVGDFAKYLQHPENRRKLSFELRQGGYDTRDHQAGPDAPVRRQMTDAGWAVRRLRAMEQKLLDAQRSKPAAPQPDVPADPFARAKPQPSDPLATTAPPLFDTSKHQFSGAVLGIALTSRRDHQGEDHFLLVPGEDVKISFPTAGMPPKIASEIFTVVDFYESKMSEYDSSFVFVPMRKLQELRGLIDPTTGIGRVNSIQIQLKPGADLDAVRDRLRQAFPAHLYGIYTWQDKQSPLLAAVQMETAILNVLLFLIIAVAGFGILAVFFMIVVEKTRDVGILKSLGAPGMGVMGIFLSYGLSLGLVGSGVGMVLGLVIVRYINEIADLLGKITGQPVFDPSIYYFYSIPTIVHPWTITWIVGGAMSIAVMASVLPALRAALLHPVEALRYE